MKYQHIHHGSHALIVYFAGWGTPLSIVQHFTDAEKYDLLLCYDYQDLRLDFDFSNYQEIYLVAWSMGVWVAEQVLQNISCTKAIAINGTSYPRHDQLGIPEAIFDGTLTGLNQSNRHKFERRMCQNKTLLAAYQAASDYRDLENIQQELAFLSQQIRQQTKVPQFNWDLAWIGAQDRIFPVDNQQAAWQERCEIRTLDAGHLAFPFFQKWEDLWR